MKKITIDELLQCMDIEEAEELFEFYKWNSRYESNENLGCN